MTEGNLYKKPGRRMIKICGLTTEEDVKYANRFLPDFAGFVLFFEKSPRNLSIKAAGNLKKKLIRQIKSVAVTVSPTEEQVEQIMESGFDYVQIHGTLKKKVYDKIEIPILRALHVGEWDAFDDMKSLDKIAGYLFDSHSPGSGKPFDWALMHKIKRDEKMFFLAGGINETNVLDAIVQAEPDGIDVSSAVERQSGAGKDPEKMKRIIRMVHDEQ